MLETLRRANGAPCLIFNGHFVGEGHTTTPPVDEWSRLPWTSAIATHGRTLVYTDGVSTGEPLHCVHLSSCREALLYADNEH